MNYYCTVNDLVKYSDIPFNGIQYMVPYHDLLTYYTTYRVYLIEGEMDKVNLYAQEYVARLKTAMSDIGKRPNYIPGMSGPNNSR